MNFGTLQSTLQNVIYEPVPSIERGIQYYTVLIPKEGNKKCNKLGFTEVLHLQKIRASKIKKSELR